MKKFILIVVLILLVAALGYAGYFAYKNLRGIVPAITDPKEDIADIIDKQNSDDSAPSENSTDFPLTLPDGFRIDVFAKNLSGARVIAFDQSGNLWVSRPKAGVVTKLTVTDGKVTEQKDVFRGLRNPHGLAFDPADANILYIAEEHEVIRVRADGNGQQEKIADLPNGAGHNTRTIGFGPDGRLYVAVGSSCNVCREQDPHRAVIFSMNKDGSDQKVVATGLRNTVFFAWHPETKQLWGTDMGRDRLGDTTPPDEVNIIEEDNPSTTLPSTTLPSTTLPSTTLPSTTLRVKDYGWPICYGAKIHDSDFDKNQYIRNPCEDPVAPHIELPAHVAPLGLAFIPSNWLEDMRGDLLVAEHGSWNSSVPVGYKIVRLKLDDKGNYEGTEDFISGWLKNNNALGRPVDLVIGSDNALYVSDDQAGVVYAVTYQENAAENISNVSADTMVTVTKPASGEAVTSPLFVSGKARGTWFFEASFSAEILDGNGTPLGAGIMKTNEPWMTEDFVPFFGTISFEQAKTNTGYFVLKKANPSDLPELDAEIKIPVRFSFTPGAPDIVGSRTKDGCVITGCSNEICADGERMSPCIYKEEYICYQKAFCEKGTTGVCGWRETAEIGACVEQYKN